jgi:hypothetical protein
MDSDVQGDPHRDISQGQLVGGSLLTGSTLKTPSGDQVPQTPPTLARTRLAVIHAALGHTDRMFDALERTAVAEPHHIGRILLQPEIAARRADPRLTAFRTRFNQPASGR